MRAALTALAMRASTQAPSRRRLRAVAHDRLTLARSQQSEIDDSHRLELIDLDRQGIAHRNRQRQGQLRARRHIQSMPVARTMALLYHDVFDVVVLSFLGDGDPLEPVARRPHGGFQRDRLAGRIAQVIAPGVGKDEPVIVSGLEAHDFNLVPESRFDIPGRRIFGNVREIELRQGRIVLGALDAHFEPVDVQSRRLPLCRRRPRLSRRRLRNRLRRAVDRRALAPCIQPDHRRRSRPCGHTGRILGCPVAGDLLGERFSKGAKCNAARGGDPEVPGDALVKTIECLLAGGCVRTTGKISAEQQAAHDATPATRSSRWNPGNLFRHSLLSAAD
ncbi:MAG: hypothetical protein ABI831_20780 [Betaproteobacteria bacterium]